MNPQQYYQVAVSAGVQGLPAYGQPHYYANPDLSGGLHIAVPPPPPPAVAHTVVDTKNQQPLLAADAPQATINNTKVDESNGKALVVSVKTEQSQLGAEAESQPIPEAQTAKKTPVPMATVPSSVSVPPSAAHAPLIGSVGVYAGAYIQPTVAHGNPQAASNHLQYVMTNPAVPNHIPAAQGARYMVMPQQYGAGLAANPYAAAGAAPQPMVYTDPTGKTYLINNAYQPQAQYYIAPPAGVKAQVPGQQVMMVGGSQYYAALQAQAQASASLQPMFARQPSVPAAQAVAGFGNYAAAGGMHGVTASAAAAAANPTSPTAPVYYYY